MTTDLDQLRTDLLGAIEILTAANRNEPDGAV